MSQTSYQAALPRDIWPLKLQPPLHYSSETVYCQDHSISCLVIFLSAFHPAISQNYLAVKVCKLDS